MNVLLRIMVTLGIGFFSTQLDAQENYSITVRVEGANSDKGKMFLALYQDKAAFLKEPFKALKSDITDKQCEVIFEDLEAGTYAVSIFHDENDNGKMDTNFMGIPKEDYGCSNNASGFMGPPKWNDAKFELTEDISITITL